MKNNSIKIKNLLLISLLAISLGSCKKEFLEINPRGAIIPQALDQYKNMLNNASALVNMNASAQTPMGDEVAGLSDQLTGTSRNEKLFRWEDVIYPDANTDAGEIQSFMGAIFICNEIINGVMNATTGSEQDKKAVRAEALATRAYYYFYLIQYFGKPYNEATAANDLGFPIVVTSDATAKEFTRASLKEVYDFIVSDLTTAIPDIQATISSRLNMSKPAAQAMLGKVYMFMGKFNEALPLLDAAFAGLANTSLNIRLYDYNTTTATAPFPGLVTNDEESIFVRRFTNSGAVSNQFLLAPHAASLYSSSDLRRRDYSLALTNGTPLPAGMLRRLRPATPFVGVRLNELYLLRAETKARLNDLPGAKADIEALRLKRLPAADAVVPDAIATNQIEFIKFLLEERIREFGMQGYRWFDMRRLSVDPIPSLRGTVIYSHNEYDGSGNIVNTHTLRPERMVLRLPQKVLDWNPDMQDNP